MKKFFVVFSLFFLIITSSFAKSLHTNECIENIDEHQIDDEDLNLSKCHLQDRDIPAIADYLDSHKYISGLILSNNSIGNSGVIALAKNIGNLNFLDLHDNNISDEGASALSKYIVNHTALYLTKNKIGSNGIIALAKNNFIYQLRIGGENWNNEAFFALATNKTFDEILIEDSYIDNEKATILAKYAVTHGIHLYNNNLDSKNAAIIATNPLFTSLGINKNNLGDEGAIALANALAKNKNRQKMSVLLEDNNIGNKGAEALAKVSSVVFYVLHNNNIGDQGASAFAASSLKRTLFVCKNPITKLGIESMKKNKKLYFVADLESTTPGLKCHIEG